MAPAEKQVEATPDARERGIGLLRKYRWFLLVVIAPVVLVGIYLYGFSSDQYESEAHYLVRTQSSSTGGGSGGLSQLLGMGTAAMPGHTESMSVSDYLTSHDVVDSLRRREQLVARFRRPDIDVVSRLSTDDPTPEALLKYYRRQVDVNFDPETGITTMKVRAFRPKDASELASALLNLGEERVNAMNVRSYADAVTLSRRQRDEAEASLRQIQRRLTAFRQSGRDVNPTGTAQAQLGLVTQLTGELSAARAQLATTIQLIGGRNPQVDALRQQVRSLEAQVGAQNGRLSGGGGNTIAVGLGDFEGLRMQQEFLAKRYDAVTAAYETARQQAVRQQLYVVRVVNANEPVKSTFPRRALTLITLLAALLVIYGIGWLITAGVREHAV